MSILVVASVFILGFWTWQSELSIRLAGYALQVVGMVFAIRGLLGIRAHFGQPLMRHLFVEWLKRFPKLKRNQIIDLKAANIVLTAMTADVELWGRDDPAKPIQDRIENLVKNVERIRQDQKQHSRLIGDLQDQQTEHKIKTEENSQNLEKRIRSDIELLHTNDIVTSLIGLMWITIGMTFSTFAPEFYQFISEM